MAEFGKKVFISYSWAVQERVVELAERLIANGVDVVLDVYDLKEGQDKYAFMEQSVNDPSVDRVLIICDKSYTIKADDRTGGVGDETVIISPEVYGQMNQEKFIPVVFEVDEDGNAYRPTYLKSRIYIDLSTEDDRYEVEYEKLLRNIYEKPVFKKPAIGKKPDWLENDTVDLSRIRDINKQVRGYSGENPTKADFLLRKASDEFVSAAKQFICLGDKPHDEELLIAIDQSKGFRDLFADYCECLIYSGLPVAETIGPLFERLYNELHTASTQGSYGAKDFEVFDFMLWELFIAATAIMLHYEKYADLHELLIRPYFLKDNFFGNRLKADNYFQFRKYIQTIETECKPKSENPKRLSMTADILVHREKKPLLTKESLTNADLVLYQLGQVLDITEGEYDYWFPNTYVYGSGVQPLWQRLKSLSYCKRIAPLFGEDGVEGLKSRVQKSVYNPNMGYNHSFNAAPTILNSIKADEIASIW